jgi:hypothetical protein
MATLIASSFEVIPTGEYLARITSIEPAEGNFGPRFKFNFEIEKPRKFEGRSLCGWVSQSGSINSKLMKWASAALNCPISPGETVDTESLTGRQVVLVVVVESRFDGTEYNRICGVKAYGG